MPKRWISVQGTSQLLFLQQGPSIVRTRRESRDVFIMSLVCIWWEPAKPIGRGHEATHARSIFLALLSGTTKLTQHRSLEMRVVVLMIALLYI